MMRIAPIGYLFNSLKEVEEQTKLATIPSHNSKEAIECATIITKIIFLARKGFPKDEIIKKLNITLYEKVIKRFNYTCYDMINICLYAVFTTNSFDDAIKKILSYGGDTDTNACIVSGLAEALYGIDEQYVKQANEKLPEEFTKLLKKAYIRLK